MRRQIARWLGGSLLLVYVSSGFAEDSAQSLVRLGSYWQERGREDKAVDAWSRALELDPRSPEALTGLGAHHARAGRLEQARDLLTRLRQAHPGHPELAPLERQVELGPRYEQLLQQARSLVKQRQVMEALARYREAFGNASPPRRLALEFFQTLGGTEAGWEEARRGLQALVERNPQQETFLWAYAQHLTFREATREEGIAELKRLESDPVVGARAQASLRQAMGWLPPAAQGLKRGQQVHQAFEALQRSEWEEAERLFQAVARDQDPAVLTGQAMVALQRQQFERAQQLLERAKALAPRQPELWERSLHSATFWALVKKAEKAKAEEGGAEAERLLLAAVALPAEERHQAEVMLAQLHLEGGKLEEAQGRLEKVLTAHPEHVPAMRALVEVLVRAERGEQARAVNRRLTRIDSAQAWVDVRLESELLRWRALRTQAERRFVAARADLLSAHQVDPDNPWVLLDLSNLLIQMGELAPAQEALEKLSKLEPQLVEGKVAQVRLMAAKEQWQKALSLLEALPPQRLDPPLKQLRKALAFRLEVGEVVGRSAKGDRAQAREELRALQQRVLREPDLSSVVAEGWAELGAHDQAITLMHEALAHEEEARIGLKLRLAAILLRAGRELELEELLSQLNADPSLTPQERQGLVQLRVANGVRRADRRREAGEYALALRSLSPLLQEYPENPPLLCALGRLFQSGGQVARAEAVFVRVLKEHPEDLEARQGLVEAALSRRDLPRARRLVEEGLERHPRSVQMRLLTARVALAASDDRAAMEALREGVALQEGHPASSEAKPGLAHPAGAGTTASLVREASEWLASAEHRPRGEDGLSLQRELHRQLQLIEDRHQLRATPGTQLRRREGEAALSALTEFRVPLEVSIPLAYRGHLGLRVTPVMLDAGPLSANHEDRVQRFGAAEAWAAWGEPLLPQSARGTELGVGFASGGLKVELGSTPLGFPVQNLVGSLSYRREISGLGLSVQLGRLPVTDSLLSYAGTRDPSSGIRWGGVLRQGGRVDVALLSDRLTSYLYGGWRHYAGRNVASNSAWEGGAGVEWKLHQGEQEQWMTGLALAGTGFERNLRHFTLGHGGYFSPQGFVHAGIPFQWSGERDRLRWKLSADPGLNWFVEDRSPYFPHEGWRQQARQARTDGQGLPLTAFYPARSSVAFALDAGGQVSYLIGDRLEAGLSLRLHRAEDFQEVVAGISAGIRFGQPSGARPGAVD